MTDTRKPIVVVGSINMDLTARVPQLPRAGQTLTADEFLATPGGKGANQAVAVARLGYPVWMMGQVGSSAAGAPEPFADALVAHLAANGVRTEAIERTSGPSGLAQIIVASSGENTIVVIPGANRALDCAAIDRHAALILSAGMVLCQLETPLESTLYTLALCASAQVPVMLDPAPALPLPESAWSRITWFTPNQNEAEFFLGESMSAEEGARRFLARGLRGVVLKRGVRGAFAAVAGGPSAAVNGFPVEVVDTVAAGDCWNGAFAVALLEGKELSQAMRFACAAAALSVTRRGAQAAMPARDEVESFLRAHAEHR